jgi:4,5-dihydroxyphthalate decarboxylase
MASEGDLPVTLATRDYDFVAPLALGDVVAAGIRLTLIRVFRALERVLRDPAVHGGEASFSRYVQRLAAGDRAFVGLPVFVMREFRHRNFFVPEQSGLRDLRDLAGQRVGMDAWPNSGNTWSRALLREAGVRLEDVRWMVGPINPGDPLTPPDALPPGVERAPEGRALRDLLLAGELDVLISAWAPEGFYDGSGGIRRLYADYRTVERQHYQRTRLYPAHHVVVLRRELVDRAPWAVRSLYAAFRAARETADRARLVLHESSPWLLADLEEQRALMGPDHEPYGLAGNREMIAAFCAEQWGQRLVPREVHPDEVFAEFERLTA